MKEVNGGEGKVEELALHAGSIGQKENTFSYKSTKECRVDAARCSAKEKRIV